MSKSHHCTSEEICLIKMLKVLREFSLPRIATNHPKKQLVDLKSFLTDPHCKLVTAPNPQNPTTLNLRANPRNQNAVSCSLILCPNSTVAAAHCLALGHPC